MSWAVVPHHPCPGFSTVRGQWLVKVSPQWVLERMHVPCCILSTYHISGFIDIWIHHVTTVERMWRAIWLLHGVNHSLFCCPASNAVPIKQDPVPLGGARVCIWLVECQLKKQLHLCACELLGSTFYITMYAVLWIIHFWILIWIPRYVIGTENPCLSISMCIHMHKCVVYLMYMVTVSSYILELTVHPEFFLFHYTKEKDYR